MERFQSRVRGLQEGEHKLPRTLGNCSISCGAKTKCQLFGDTEILGRLGMYFTKASILLFYRRLFCTSNIRRTRIWWSIWFVFWLDLLYAIAFVLAVALECASKAPLVAEGKECVDEYAFVICASVINVTTDIMILIIPIVGVWGLHMAAEQKWRLTAVFAVGFL